MNESEISELTNENEILKLLVGNLSNALEEHGICYLAITDSRMLHCNSLAKSKLRSMPNMSGLLSENPTDEINSILDAPNYLELFGNAGVIVSSDTAQRVKGFSCKYSSSTSELSLLQNVFLHTSKDALLLIEADSQKVIDVNSAFLKLFGFESVSIFLSALTNKGLFEVLMIPTVDSSKEKWHDELQILARDGRKIWLEYSSSFFEFHENRYALIQLVDISYRKESEELVRQSIVKENFLLSELNHRIRNNLNVVVSLLDLQALRTNIPEVKLSLIEARNRVFTLSLGQELFHTQFGQNIDTLGYLKDLLSKIFYSYHDEKDFIKFKECRVEVSGEVSLGPTSLINIGIIMHEILSDLFRKGNWAFVELKFESEGIKKYRMEIRSSSSFEEEPMNPFGLKIIQSLIRQLNGTLQINAFQIQIFISPID